MTAREALRDRVEQLTEEEAAEWLALMDWEATDTETLSGDEVAEVLAGEREIAEGKSVAGEQVFRRLKL